MCLRLQENENLGLRTVNSHSFPSAKVLHVVKLNKKIDFILNFK